MEKETKGEDKKKKINGKGRIFLYLSNRVP
jgi:hypothetical protein